ncbi:MAG: Tic20 family protein [Pseudanabaenaceae cyanobacterium bins.39]|nr:Tic20 family protein [Pseudanabaenaceae cyanobacterium bins.39]
MVRRSSVDPLNRFYACLPYLFPLAAAVLFGAFLFAQFPILVLIFLPILKVNQILSVQILDFISIRFVAWFCLFIFVVRNYRVNHFIRFNAMQGLLLDVVVMLMGAIVQVLEIVLGQLPFFPFMLQILASVTFLGITCAFCYGIWHCVFGRYAEMPVVSEVAYMQVR